MVQILIVDDEETIRKLLSRYLEKAGYRCLTAESVAAAQKQLAARSFDLILSDIGMPGASGIDLIHHVHRVCPETPIVIVSAIDNPADARRALELGVYGYIVKPFTGNIVLINVENAIRRHRLEAAHKSHLAALETEVAARTRTLNDQLLFQQHLMDAIPNPVFFKDIEGRFLGCNAAFEAHVGAQRETIIGKRIEAVAPQIKPDFIERTDRQLIDRPGKMAYEMTYADRNGQPCHVIFSKATYADAAGQTIGFVGVLADITARKKAEEDLRVSEEKLRSITENIGVGVAMIDPDGTVLYANRQLRAWFPGIRSGDRVQCYQCRQRLPGEDRCDDCPTVLAMQTGQRVEKTQYIRGIEGGGHFRRISNPVLATDGRVVAVIDLMEEVSLKLAREHDLRQAQKLESIGQLAAGIAHEINTPTQYIGDNTRFLQEASADLIDLVAAFNRLMTAVKAGGPTDDLVRDIENRIGAADLDYLQTEIPLAIEQTLEGITQVSDIVASLRHFSHPGSDHKSPVDINRALAATITVARNTWKHVADLDTDFDAGLPKVFCLPGEMNQVFLNLLINAAQAIAEKYGNANERNGRITVTTRQRRDRVEIRFSDDGCGIPASVRDRIFDPFFTTKPVGGGTGQGLAIAHAVVTDKHAGTIRVDTREGHGSTFVIELPVNPDGLAMEAR